MAAFDEAAKSSRSVAPRYGRSVTWPALSNTIRSRASWPSLSALVASSSWKSSWICRVVSTPTITAKPQRMISVSTAEPPARRQRIGRRLYAEYVARAADRMEEPGFTTGFELSAEVRDEDLDRVRDREGVVAPDLVEQPLAQDHEPLVAHQVLEQLELALCEVDRALAARDLVRVRIQGQVRHPQGRHPARWAAPQERPHAREQLLALERLDEIVVRADVEALDPRVERVARGEDEDRRVVLV